MISKTFKQARICVQLDGYIPSHSPLHKLHLSLSQDNILFETSLLVLNQDTKEYTTAKMIAAEEFLFRDKWTQCTSAPHVSGHEASQDNQ